ncbi:MAG: hypothetical protein HKN33_15755 [Pyrinomonadaceae bacterium]|nr:hypothetical protein [Pyrinomonadaceae bacterium]
MKNLIIRLCVLFVVAGLSVITVIGQDGAQIVNEPKGKIDLNDYPQIKEFLYQDENRFGSIDKLAPPETAQFGQLSGIWEAENRALFQGKWYCCWRALWGFKYTIDGFGVQDYYLQLERDLPPTVPKKGKNSTLTQLRVFLPKEKKWKVAWISNATAYGTFDAVEKEGELIMTPPPVKGRPLRRIIFYDIKKDSFLWRREISEDKGKTWETRFFIKATRIL